MLIDRPVFQFSYVCHLQMKYHISCDIAELSEPLAELSESCLVGLVIHPLLWGIAILGIGIIGIVFGLGS